jgi:membrane fusion protein (multidrug efflux system)
MKKRLFIVIGAMLLFIAVIGFVKYSQVKAAIAQNSGYQPPPEAVTSTVAEEVEWPATVRAVGSVEADQGVVVSADLPGIVERIAFESGQPVKKGELLVQLDTSQERAQLAAAESASKLAAVNLERMQGLRAKGVTSQAELDRMEAEAQQSTARAGEIRATIERKRIRAPFSGVLGIRQVNLGQYLNGGDPVVPLQTLDPILVNFAVPQQQVAALAIGRPVSVTGEGVAGAKSGKITAVDSVIDSATRNVQVQATFNNPDGALKPGMFVETQIDLGNAQKAVALPTSAINYAPYGDSVFVIEDVTGPKGDTYRGVRQQVVKLGPSRGDQVAILSGVKPGEEVVTSGVFKLRPGAAVVVNNETMPANSATPKPEDS